MLLGTETHQNSFEQFEIITEDGRQGYSAGLPGFPSNFTRDSILSGIIAGSLQLLDSQLSISERYQGTREDAFTGEQLGKMHHEIPGVKLANREGLTTYNGCDTTSLYLMGTENASILRPDDISALHRGMHPNRLRAIERSVDYLRGQTALQDELFWEFPPQGAEEYSLLVTYWKDSRTTNTNGKKEPVYPVTYSLAHFMAARAFLSAGRLLNAPELEAKADNMYRKGIQQFITPDHFTVYKDKEETLNQVSSDELHALAYIPAKYSDLLPLQEISERAQQLTTDYGFFCAPPDISMYLDDEYHGSKIWVFEQAMIHYGATKHGLHAQAKTANKIAPHIGAGQELFAVTNGTLAPMGNDRQLWSVAANHYFNGQSNLLSSMWL